MATSELYEVVIPTDRWTIRAVSPVDIRDGVDESMGHPVIIHPGWGKAPERHAELMADVAATGLLPIGVDTRYGYADQTSHQAPSDKSKLKRTVEHSWNVGSTNPYFDVEDRTQNRFQLRRPTSLLYLCERLGIVNRSYVGHSEGARVVSIAAQKSAELDHNVGKVVIVNGVGTGDSSNGYLRLLRSNSSTIETVKRGDLSWRETVASAIGSTGHYLTHPRRTLREKHVIQNTNLWETIDQLRPLNIPVSVLHARDDALVSFQESAEQAQERPWVHFQATDGSHTNVYGSVVRGLILGELTST